MILQRLLGVKFQIASTALEVLNSVFIVDLQMTLQASLLSRSISANLALKLIRPLVAVCVLVKVKLTRKLFAALFALKFFGPVLQSLVCFQSHETFKHFVANLTLDLSTRSMPGLHVAPQSVWLHLSAADLTLNLVNRVRANVRVDVDFGARLFSAVIALENFRGGVFVAKFVEINFQTGFF